MSLVFIGTVEFSRYALKGLLDAHAPIQAVFTLDLALRQSVSDFATFDNLLQEKNIPQFFVRHGEPDFLQQRLQTIKPDFIYVIGWSRLVKKEVLATAKQGGIGLHPTLLPEGRGRAPIPWTILKGLRRSGVSLFHLIEAADAGDIITQSSYDVSPDETATTLYQKVCQATYRLVKETYPLLAAGLAPRRPQDESKTTHWTKRTPEDGLIDWNRSSTTIDTLIRAVTHPYPGAFSYLRGKKIIIWRGKPIQTTPSKRLPAGVVTGVNGKGVIVQTGDNTLVLESVQMEPDVEKSAVQVLKAGDVLDANG